MAKNQPFEFRNVVLCDDVRDEIGNKKSLMGVMSGDILVPTFPAMVQVAMYLEFVPEDKEQKYKLSIFLHVDDEKIAEAAIEIVLGPTSPVGIVVFPKGIVRFENESAFIVSAKVNEGSEIEISRKKVMLSKPS